MNLRIRQPTRLPPALRHQRARRVSKYALSLLAAACALSGLNAAAPEAVTATALAPRSVAAGPTLFTRLAPETTGIVAENKYADPRMWTDRYQELVYGAIGTGVAIGDYDRDARPDVLVVSKVEGYRLFRNRGNWQFEDVTTSAKLGPATGWIDRGLAWARSLWGSEERDAAPTPWHQGATFADVNNDGWLDLYLCRMGARNRLYINQHDGTFREEAAARGLAVEDGSGMAAFADYDRDGWLDVYLQTNFLNVEASPQGQPDYLFRNNGDGTFTNVTSSAGVGGVSAGHSVTWWDFDDDGWPDVYVANDFSTPDRLYRNNRDGTFSNVIDQVMPHTPYYAMGSDLGDVNNDGWLDFFVADMAGTSHQKEQRGMASSRARAQENPETAPAAPQYMRNALYLSTGLAHVREAAALAGLAASDWTWSVRWEDLDNDGHVDLHVTNGMNREYHNVDLLERLMRVEDLTEPRRIMRASPVMAEANLAFRNRGDLHFEEVGAAWGLNERGVSFGAAFGDLDGDGDLDLVYTNYEGGPTVLRNDAPGGNRVILELDGQRSNRSGVGATVRLETETGVHTRALTLSRGYLSSSEPILHFGLGPAERIRRLTIRWPSGTEQVLTDLAVNQRYRIREPDTVATPAPAAAAVVTAFREVSQTVGLALARPENQPEGTRPQPLLPFRFNRPGPALAAGDVTGDGRIDIIVGGTGEADAQLLVGGPTGFAAQALGVPQLPSAAKPGPLLLLDVNGDDRLDLLVSKAGAAEPAGSPAYQPELFLNTGSGRFTRAPANTLPALPISAGATVAADVDRDGRLDVFLGGRLLPGQYPQPARSALLLNRGGRFEDVTDQWAPGLRETGLVTAALWSDVTGDGWLDLVLAREWGTVQVWQNQAGRGLVDRTEDLGFGSAGSGWWTSLAAADFNGDGRIDYVAGNAGLNTPYRATPEHPALLFSADFRGTGTAPQLVEGFYEGERLFPRRIRRELGAEIPTVLRRFPRNDHYARSTLAEILGEERLAAAQRFAATELRSGVFLSEPDGRFRFLPLPRVAQIAPLQGLATGDFDGDGATDLYAVQNNHSPIPAIGRFDGGLSQLLQGDGRGGFTPVAPESSGLLVPGDAKALVTLDLAEDGWADFLVSRNHHTTLAFQQQSRPGRTPLQVRLQGPPGNRAAVGALVQLELSDGRTQTLEVYAGSGYWSQSDGGLFFGYPAEAPPRRLRVRWPSGLTTEHVPAPADRVLRLTAP